MLKIVGKGGLLLGFLQQGAAAEKIITRVKLSSGNEPAVAVEVYDHNSSLLLVQGPREMM